MNCKNFYYNRLKQALIALVIIIAGICLTAFEASAQVKPTPPADKARTDTLVIIPFQDFQKLLKQFTDAEIARVRIFNPELFQRIRIVLDTTKFKKP